MSITLRLKLLLIPLLFLFIPLLGIPLLSMGLNDNLENRLVELQKKVLTHTAQTVSNTLNGRSDLFYQDSKNSRLPKLELNITQLSNPIRINGEIDDWRPEIDDVKIFGSEHLLTFNIESSPDSLSYRHIAGKQGQYLYALFDIQDDHVVYRNQDTLRLDRSDHLQITIYDDEEQRNYIVACHKPGWVVGFYIPDSPSESATVERRIHGQWKQTDKGYTLEIRIHTELFGSKLAFTIADVDDQNTEMIKALIGTTKLNEGEERDKPILNPIVIDNFLETLELPNVRVRIVDRNNLIRAEVGKLDEISEHFSAENPKKISQSSINDIQGVTEAFEGKNTFLRYHEKDGPFGIMVAIAPIYENGEVIALVIVDKSTSSLLVLSNQLYVEITLLFILAFLFSAGGVFLYSFRISAQRLRINHQADTSY